MFQSFEDTSQPEQGPARLKALREQLEAEGLDGFIVPRADVHQGEYVAARDERLSWLTGFTGSAGHCIALLDKAGVFVDSRYRLQVRAQVAAEFQPVDWPETSLADWISAQAPDGARIGFDPWLMTVAQLRDMEKALGTGTLHRSDNLIDRIWTDQPDPPQAPVFAQPIELAGEPHSEKILRLSKELLDAETVILTLPDSICWLLNIRGGDVPRTPLAHGFAMLHRDKRVTLFMDQAKLSDLRGYFGDTVTVRSPSDLLSAIARLSGPVQIDPSSCPVAVADALTAANVEILEANDPCALPKARKNAAELAGARAAHLRDGAAMARFLRWIDEQQPGGFTEIDAVRRLEEERRATNCLRDISFDTISGAGPNGAIVHYRVTDASNSKVEQGLLLMDSGGQYVDGTTDITRTVSVGDASDNEVRAFTLVLKGMIAISRLRWPAGLSGRDIDPLARVALWENGLDYGHGTGHGVGSYLMCTKARKDWRGQVRCHSNPA